MQSCSRFNRIQSSRCVRHGRGRLCRHRRCALTLIEVLVVLVIMAVMAGSVLTLAEPTAVSSLKAAARGLAGSLRFARNLAVVNNTDYHVTIDKNSDTYWAEHVGTTGSDDLPPFPFMDSMTSGSGKPYLLGDFSDILGTVGDISIHVVRHGSTEVYGVTFNSIGEPVGRAAATVVWLHTSNGNQDLYQPVIIAPTTGLVSIGDVQGTAP